MIISGVSLQNFRIHGSIVVEFSPGTTIITGPNGSGKTSIIEALYVALRGTSFKGVDGDILGPNRKWWRVDISFSDGTKRSVKYNPESINGKKQFIIDGKTHYRLPAKNKKPVVLFEPNDLRLLNGSPGRRREFIDKFISQINPEYHMAINKYERALKQRNNLLKNKNSTSEDLFVWDVVLSEYGAQIIQQRLEFIDKINDKINSLYQELSETKDAISVHYSHPYSGDIKQKLLNELSRSADKDRVLGYTTTGPHRNDIIFNFNNSPALTIASRGEVRTVIVALKFLEVALIEDVLGVEPLILLDDVFSELDEKRQKHLSRLDGSSQVVITSTTSPATNKKSLGTKIRRVNLRRED